MQALDFVVASCQATLFTPEAEFSGSHLLSRLLPKPKWIERFDGEPTVLPLPEMAPRDVPKVILQSASGEWRCEVASGRFNIHWLLKTNDADGLDLQKFVEVALPLLQDYQRFVDSRIDRLAAVITRYAVQDSPGRFLARHFCKDRWLEAPFNRPESFELHAHKRFTLGAQKVNSWVRNKTGTLKSEEQRTIVVVEQDINTPGEESNEFSDVDISRFFTALSAEFDGILRLYYPA